MSEPEMIERADGTKEWWVDGKYHRLDGPAYEGADGTKEWWVGDKLHRLDGPAIERADGTKEWWVRGRHVPDADIARLGLDGAVAKACITS